MLSALFVTSGMRALTMPGPLEARAKPVAETVGPVLRKVHPRLPTRPRDLVRLNGAVQVTAGLLLATSHLTRPAAMALAGSLVPTTIAGHPFWRESDPARRREGQIQVMKNMGILGGLLLAAVDTEGRPSMRRRAHHLAESRQRLRRFAPIIAIGNIGRKLPKLARQR